MNFSEISKQFDRRINAIYSANYQTLRAAINEQARRVNKKVADLVPNVQATTLRRYFAADAEKEFKERTANLLAKRQVLRDIVAQAPKRISPEHLRARISMGSFSPLLLVKSMEEFITNALNVYRANEQNAAVDLLTLLPYTEERINAILAQNISQTENNRIYVNLPAIIEALNNTFGIIATLNIDLSQKIKDWININRLANIFVPPNRMLFVMRVDIKADKTRTVWAAWRNPDGSYLIGRNRGFPWATYAAGISDEYRIESNRYFLFIDIVEPKREGRKFQRVGYSIYNTPGEKNCLVRILSPFVQNDVRQKFDEMTRDLIHKQDKPAYIEPDFIDRLGKLMRVKISLYSPYGAFKDIPTQILGAQGNKKNFKIIVNNQHANVFAPAIVNKVKYLTDITDYIEQASKPNMSTVIDVSDTQTLNNLAGSPWQYCHEAPKETGLKYIAGFITVDGFGTEAVTTMNKYLRPSAITGIAADDENPALFNKTTPAGIFMYNFVRKNNITTPPEFVARMAAQAGRPFGTALMRKQKKGGHVIEIDQNASYASYEFSPFYTGFPVGNWMKIAGAPKDLPDPELKPAFIEVAAISAKETTNSQLNEYIYNYAEMLGQLRENFSVITYPEYLRWSKIFDIEVINTTYATFQRISVYDDLNELTQRIQAACPATEWDDTAAYVKAMRNGFTGKLIQGGLDTYDTLKTITTTSKTEFEIMVAEHERDFGELPHCEIVTLHEQTNYKITTRVNKPGHRYPHIYAYITAISRLSVLEKLAQLRHFGFKPVRVHVDAIYVRWFGKLNGKATAAHVAELIPDIDPTTPGKFKAFESYKTFEIKEPTKSTFNINDGQFYGIMSQAQPAADGYPGHRTIAICGPGGVGKSTVAVNFLRDGNGRALYLTPTRELRGELRAKLDDVGKNPADCICLESVRRAIEAVDRAEERGRRAPPEYLLRLTHIKETFTHIIIDEFGKTDGGDIATVLNFADRYSKNVIMMGDYNQTIFSKDDGFQVTKEQLTEWGFMLFEDPRNARAPGKPMRHSYEWGTFLDSIAGKPSAEQVEALRAYGIRVIDENAELDRSGLVYCGNWATIARYNGALLANDTAQRLRIINKKETCPYVPALKPYVWNKRAFAEPQPRGMKYTVDFAITVDCVQGSTVENPNQYIHVASLSNRWGAIYTAVTRSRTPEQITLII